MICPPLFLFLTCAYQDDLKALEKVLQAAVSKGDTQEAARLARVAVDKGSSEHVKVVVAVLPRAGLRAYWALIDTLRELKTEEGLSSLTDEILRLKGKPEARDLVQLVLSSKSGKKDDLISRFLEGTDVAIRTACVDAIVRDERKAFLPKLIELLEANERGTEKLPVGMALKNLTGLDLGPSAAWRRWWERDGKTFECPKVDSTASFNQETVVGYLKRNRWTQYKELRKGSKRGIAVVRGDWDRVEQVLDKLEIPYVLVSNDQVANGAVDGMTTFAILENCESQGVRGKPLSIALRKFVDEGGGVFASHYSMDVVWVAFPGYGAPVGSRSKEVVDIFPARGTQSDSLMREVFAGGFSQKWKMHDCTTTFRPESDDLVALVEGPDLGPRAGTSAPLAGYFRHGRKSGVVVLVAGHMADQIDKEGEFTLQNLLLNFLIEAQENFRARGGK